MGADTNDETGSESAAGTEVAYVNGVFLPIDRAVVSIDDRGFQFADGVYEVVSTYGGRPYAMEAHMDRLQSSLQELRIPYDVTGIPAIVTEGIRRGGFAEALVYIQITRGVAPWHHEFPRLPLQPTVVMTVKQLHRPDATLHQKGVSVVTTPDLRWKRCDIKSIALLPNILAKQLAHEAGAYEALLVDDQQRVTEGSSTSSFRVDGGVVFTSPPGPHILPSITRGVLIDLIRELGIELREEFSSVAAYRSADEVFLAGTTTEAMPVIRIDETQIGDGAPGPVTRRIRQAFEKSVRAR
ncbi:MAG: D-amino acid aminotransferase [bacterium]|nr:D-amino acid aminotransferase [bacterium]